VYNIIITQFISVPFPYFSAFQQRVVCNKRALNDDCDDDNNNIDDEKFNILEVIWGKLTKTELNSIIYYTYYKKINSSLRIFSTELQLHAYPEKCPFL
jgi:hypothetical protein